MVLCPNRQGGNWTHNTWVNQRVWSEQPNPQVTHQECPSSTTSSSILNKPCQPMYRITGRRSWKHRSQKYKYSIIYYLLNYPFHSVTATDHNYEFSSTPSQWIDTTINFTFIAKSKLFLCCRNYFFSRKARRFSSFAGLGQGLVVLDRSLQDISLHGLTPCSTVQYTEEQQQGLGAGKVKTEVTSA